MELETASRIMGIVEGAALGGCLGGLFVAGQSGQWTTALFACSTIWFIYMERGYRKDCQAHITERESSDKKDDNETQSAPA